MNFLTKKVEWADKRNSFFDAAFGTGKRIDIAKPKQDKLANLSSISALYLYSNPPPIAYGTPGPKVIESVKRAYDFNHKEKTELKVGEYTLDNPVWLIDEDGAFPHDKVGSNFLPGMMHAMDKSFLIKNQQCIDSCAQETIDELLSKNSDILTKGNQTWCPLTYSSVPCASAYQNACDFLVENGFPNHHTLVEFVKYFCMLTKMPEVKGKKLKYEYVKSYKYKMGQRLLKVRKIRRIVDHVYRGDEVQRYSLNLARSFCSYLKHAERAHLARRAIASPSVFLRALLLLTETFHLKLGKKIEGSTISIGGEEKKAKIIATMGSAGIAVGQKTSLQATEDATKWNECLSASNFGMMTETFFNSEVREELKLPELTAEVQLLHKLMMVGHFILGIKRITLGEGVMGFAPNKHGHMSYKEENLPRFNDYFRPNAKWAIEHLSDDLYLEASPGMLMGMLNAGSTTRGLTPVGFGFENEDSVCQLRSSDDSMTLFTGDNLGQTLYMVSRQKVLHRCIAVNGSEKKSTVYKAGVGEYTSWYHDGTMVAQYGAEVTTLRPGGKNPPDDFFGILKGTAVSQLQLESNFLGAALRIRLGCLNVRSLYKIKLRNIETSVRNVVRVMADGGTCIHNIINCHLEETSLKESLAENQAESDYFYRIRDPTNPFNNRVEEEVVYDPSMGSLTVSIVETPRTIFHFVKKSNRAIVNSKGPSNADKEKAHAEAGKILLESDVSLNLKIPGTATLCSDHIIEMLQMMHSEMTLNPKEEAAYKNALKKLRTKVSDFPSEDEDQSEFSPDEEMDW